MSQEQKYGGIWTKKGVEKLASFINGGNPIHITESAFGDGNGTIPIPDTATTSLVHEVWRGKVTSITQKEGEHSQSVIVEVVIPYNVGGFFIREWGLYDADGDLVVYGNHAEFYKALLIEGTGAELRELIELPISAKGQVQITVNYESLASVDYVNKTLEEKLNEHNESEEAHQNIVANLQEQITQIQEGVGQDFEEAQKRGVINKYLSSQNDILPKVDDFNKLLINQVRYVSYAEAREALNSPCRHGGIVTVFVFNKSWIVQEYTYNTDKYVGKFLRQASDSTAQGEYQWENWIWAGSCELDFDNAVDITEQIPFVSNSKNRNKQDWVSPIYGVVVSYSLGRETANICFAGVGSQWGMHVPLYQETRIQSTGRTIHSVMYPVSKGQKYNIFCYDYGQGSHIKIIPYKGAIV